MKIKLFNFLLILISLFCLLTSGCTKEFDNEPLYFIGDSLIERWDLQSHFSSRITYNLGKGGAGISYIEGKKEVLTAKTAVVLIGCNDHAKMTAEGLNGYIERYISAIENSGASKIYLLQLLPRFYEKDSPGANDRIVAFNAEMKRRVAGINRIEYVETYSHFFIDGKQVEGYFIDGVHLSEDGYTELSEILYPYLERQ